MSLPTVSDVRELSEARSGPCASFYLPTERAGAEVQQNSIRLKNLLRQAEQEMADTAGSEDAGLLEPVRELLRDQQFWRHQSDGLAIFAGAGLFRRYRLPLAFADLVVVGSRFHLSPLIPLLNGDGRFFILALSQKRVRLVEATRHRAREVELPGVPENLSEALGSDWVQRSLQFHTGAARAGGDRRQAMFHGQGSGTEDSKEEIARFFRVVDDGLMAALRDRRAPLVLAAAEYLIPIYREASRHPNILEHGVEGNPDDAGAEALQQRAWPLVEPLFRADQQASAERYLQFAGTGLASGRLPEVVAAAHDGRVDTLFVPLGIQRWGRFDAAERRTREHDGGRRPGDQDLLDLAAIESLRHGARVFAVEPDQVPGGGAVAAVFRY